MDVREAKQKKSVCEKAILDLLVEFERETGLKTTGINLHRSHIVRGFETPKLTEISIDAKL